MSAILFAPHNDDETLFAFYQVLRHRPKVFFVFRSFREQEQGGPTYATREAESAEAMKVAGCQWEQWLFPDSGKVWAHTMRLADEVKWGIQDAIKDEDASLVIAPAWEEGGHEGHNLVAESVPDGPNVIRYLTYKRGHGRSESANEVIPTAEERILKAVALKCYPSQAEYAPTAPWFDPADQREFLA